MAAAADIDAFYRAVAPQPCTDATVLVLSVDGKGVVMRPEALREATLKAAQAKGPGPYRTRLASGEKPARKRMATLGVVYDAEPAPRRPHDVICVPAATAEGPSGQRPRRVGPKAQAKWLTGSVTADSEQVIAAVFDQAEQRDPSHRRTWVVLVDGARHQLDLVGAEAARRGVRVHILIDLIHVMEYLWKAAWVRHEAPPYRAGWKDPAAGLSQQAGEAEGSPNAETRGRAGAALTTTGRTGTARRCGSGKRDGTPYDRNQCQTPRNHSTGSNLADLGRDAVHAADGGDSKPAPGVGEEATLKVCGVGVAMLPGSSWTARSSTGG